MKLEYFGLHGRAQMIRMALHYCNVEFEDVLYNFQEWGQKKATGNYEYGQLPVLTLDDGTQLSQSVAILRYVGAAHKGRNGERLYPGNENPEITYEIDCILDTLGEQTQYFTAFLFEMHPGYKNKDEHFT